MTDSKDDLYPKDLYPQGTPHRKNDQESQGGSAVEPLFPSAPHTSQSWLDHADDIHAGDVHAGDVYTDKAQTTATPADFGQSHADTPDHNLYEDNARGDSAQGEGDDPYRALYESYREAESQLWQESEHVAATAPPTPMVEDTPDSLYPSVNHVASGESVAPIVHATPKVTSHKPAISEKEALFNRHFAVLMDMMQHGAWPQALEKIQAMRADYPDMPALDSLYDEALLKSELMAQWTHKIKGRRLTVGQEWLLRRSLPFLLLLVLFISGAIFYQNYIAPSRQVVAMERANQALVEEASGLLRVGQVNEAINLYNLVLERDPNNSPAQQGLVEANRLQGVAVTYDLAIRVANQGNLERSLRMFQSIKAQSPSFRDIDARLARVDSLLQAEHAYNLAEKSFVQRRWMDAIRYYQQTQVLAADYQAFRVSSQLSISYFMAAQKLMNQWPTAEFGTAQIRDFLRGAQKVHGNDEVINTALTQIEEFIRGERSLGNNNFPQAIETWRKLFEAQPALLGGYLAEELYRAYLAYASQVATSNPELARELYTLAAAMPVQDSSEARTQLQNLGASAPAAQPTPTPQPTMAYVAPVVVAAAVAAPVETPTPQVTATPVNAYQGWIAFRSTRDGGEQIYMMRGDGSEQQLAPEEIRTRIDGLYQEERRSPDGRLVFVQSASGRNDANIAVASNDGVNIAVLTDFTGDEYDPVWSRIGDRIVFVANHTGNDEIWAMNSDGSNQQQLTFNNWEWDKHPTWSPDGNQIAFFSNRSGQRQIWVMNSDGSNQINISNNGHDDWDPVWIK